MMSVSHEGAGELDATVDRVLDATVGRNGRVALFGGGERVVQLAAARPERYVLPDGVASSLPAACTLLALGLGEETLRQARDAAESRKAGGVFVLVQQEEAPLDGPSIRERLHSAGFAVAGIERVLWARTDRSRPPAGTRAERIGAETRAVIVRCVPMGDPGAVGELEEALERVQDELELYRQLEVEHARTREAERARAERLAELEEKLQMFGDVGLGVEVERLRAQIDAMKATRVWRVGTRYWSLKDRLRGSGK